MEGCLGTRLSVEQLVTQSAGSGNCWGVCRKSGNEAKRRTVGYMIDIYVSLCLRLNSLVYKLPSQLHHR